mgnify:CR=1 FL=1
MPLSPDRLFALLAHNPARLLGVDAGVLHRFDGSYGWAGDLAWIARPLGWAEFLLIAWMPLYLLLMQKRVYRQGWIMTLLKYCVLGTCYLFLISLGATLTLLISLVNR